MKKLQDRSQVAGSRSPQIGRADVLVHPAVRNARLDAARGRTGTSARPPEESLPATCDPPPATSFYIVVEKILTDGETLPSSFPVSGTSGYDFLSAVNNVFIDGSGLAQLDAFYRSFTGDTRSFDEIAYEKKKQVIHELFSGEMRALAKHLSS